MKCSLVGHVIDGAVHGGQSAGGNRQRHIAYIHAYHIGRRIRFLELSEFGGHSGEEIRLRQLFEIIIDKHK